MIDKRNILLLLGCYCNDPKLVLDERYQTTKHDYPELFHQMIWSAITNIAKKGNIQSIGAIEITNEIQVIDDAVKLWKDNDGWQYIEDAIEVTKDKLNNVGFYHDTVRKYSIIRNCIDYLKMDISYIYNESDSDIMDKFNASTSMQILESINSKFLNFKGLWKDAFSDNYNFHAADGIRSRLDEHKRQENTYGYPFQSGFMTTVFRGMRAKKFFIRSSITGGGKSRNSIAEACNIGCHKLYDAQKKQWISTGENKPILFISTELTKEAIQDCWMAHISGIEEDRIKEWNNITPEEELVLQETMNVIEESMMYGEYAPDFNIDSIKELIEKYIINHGVEYVFFDYINDSPSLYSYYKEKTRTNLQTHQILYMFSEELKLLANKYSIFLGSSTQLNDSYKDDENKDMSAIKGSKSIIEKADQALLQLPVTPRDLQKLKPILEADGRFNAIEPNFGYYIFKNRDGKFNRVIVWTYLNLGTMREVDCFVTNYDYELITDIERTLIEFEFEDVGVGKDIDVDESDDNLEPEEIIDRLMRENTDGVGDV